jgi:tetratricopeptide (TPR) repeat protein
MALTGAETHLMRFDKSDYDRSIDDISFVISQMHNFPNVDNSKLGLIGFCYGSIINFMVANQNSNVDVIVDLFGANNIQNTRDKVGSYRYMNLKNPKMAYLQLAGSPEERDSYMFNNYLYGDAYQYRFDNVSHNAFTAKYVAQHHYFKDQLPGGHNAEYKDTVDACYKNICKLTLQMLNAYIKNDKLALNSLSDNPKNIGINNVSHQIHKAIELPPYPNEFINIINTEGTKKALAIYNKVRTIDKNWKLFAENQMNFLGYQLMRNNQVEEAIVLFSMILSDNPDSWNGYDSIGEAYYNLGDKEKAITNYKKSLELNPQNTNAVKMLEKLDNNI